MSREEFPPRNPGQQPQVRTHSPGGSSGPRKDFHVRRVAGAIPAQRRGIRRQARIVKLHHEIWIGVALLAVVLVVAGGLWMAGRGRPKTAAAPKMADSSVRGDARGVWLGPAPFEVAEKFTSATTHAERLRWVRNPESVGPLVEEFFSEGPGASEKVAQTYPMQSTADGDLLFENFHVVFEDGTYRQLSVSVDPAGAKVDFKAYARHGSVKWEDLLSGTAKSADEMRVVLTPGGFFAHQFPDETQWLHFKATTPDLPAFMDFYVARDSEVAQELARIESHQLQVTVSLRAVGDSASHRQFEITALKSAGWTTAAE